MEINDEEFNNISEFINNAKKLNDSEITYEILTVDDVKLKTRWNAPYYFAIYGNDRINAGFIFQQVSLYLQTLGIGNCWVGMGEPEVKKDNFIILIAFGKSDDYTREITKFKRKNINDFSDFEDDKLKPAYYAPSAINSQPWYFKHNDNNYDVYQTKSNFLKRKIVGKLNQIDMGIALAHLYVSYPESFEFKVNNSYDELKGYDYIGTVGI